MKTLPLIILIVILFGVVGENPNCRDNLGVCIDYTDIRFFDNETRVNEYIAHKQGQFKVYELSERTIVCKKRIKTECEMADERNRAIFEIEIETLINNKGIHYGH